MSELIAAGNGKKLFTAENGYLEVKITDPDILKFELEKALFMGNHPGVFPRIKNLSDNGYLIERVNTDRVMKMNPILCQISMSEDDNANEFFDLILEYLDGNDEPTSDEFLDELENGGSFVDIEAVKMARNNPEFIRFVDAILVLVPRFLQLNAPRPQQDYLDLCARQFGWRGDRLLIFDW